MKKVYVRTYGCQMNVYDSERMTHALARHGYAPTGTPDDADLVILNTCHIREKAAEKVYSDLGRLRRLREARRAAAEPGAEGMLLAVAGCVAQAEGGLLVERAPFVDVVVGPQSYHRLPELLARRERERGGGGGGGAVVDTDFPPESKFDELPRDDLAAGGPSAFLAVQEGCDKFCTFCVVPYTRGAEQSRPAAAVLAEARRLAATGAREIVLLGQNVNAFHGDAPAGGGTWGLARLVRALAEIPEVERIRYTTSHPRDMDEELVRAHGEVPALMPFLHLPVQSGSDAVLEAMNRRHTAGDYLRLVDRLRDARPDMALSSDFIVGFPGEDDEAFAATLRLVGRIGFAQAFSFRYSPRPGTPAASMPRQVPERVRAERLAELQALLESQARAFDAACLGRSLPVLLERPGRHLGQLVGKSPYLQAVHVAAEPAGSRIGDMVEVSIDSVHPHSLGGTVLATTAPPPARPSPEELRA